jgi:putative DNA primase/helicase
MRPLDLVRARLAARNCDPRGSADKFTARCPAHEDRHASLSVGRGTDERVLVHCHAGCTPDAVAAALGLELADLYDRAVGPRAPRRPNEHTASRTLGVTEAVVRHAAARLTPAIAERLRELRGWTPLAIRELRLGFDGERVTFPVRDGAGALVGLLRYAPDAATRKGQPKMLADKGSRREPFPPPESIDGSTLYIGEGEGEAVALRSLGLPAIGLPGAGKRDEAWWPRIAARRDRIVVIGDCDGPGRKSAREAGEALARHCNDVRVLDLEAQRTDGYDVGDLLREAVEASGGDGYTQARRVLERAAERAERIEAAIQGAYATAFARIEREPVTWLWPERIPLGMLTLLIGDPGLGKSMLTCWLAALVTSVGGSVLLLTAEDSPSVTVRPRLEAVHADLERVHVVEIRRDGMSEGIALPDDVAELDRLVVKHNAKLVVIDPLMAHLPERVNSWRDQSVRRALAPLARMAAERGCAVLVVGHLNKARGIDPLYRAGGSVGIPAAARSALLLARDPEDDERDRGSRRVLAHVKCNVAPQAESLVCEVEPVLLDVAERIETARIAITGRSTVAVSELLGSTQSETRTERAAAADFLRTELIDGPRPVPDVERAANEAGISEHTLRRAKSDLGVKSEKESWGGGWRWVLPGWPEADQPEDGQPHSSRLAIFGGQAKNGPLAGAPDSEGGHLLAMANFELATPEQEAALAEARHKFGDSGVAR